MTARVGHLSEADWSAETLAEEDDEVEVVELDPEAEEPGYSSDESANKAEMNDIGTPGISNHTFRCVDHQLKAITDEVVAILAKPGFEFLSTDLITFESECFE